MTLLYITIFMWITSNCYLVTQMKLLIQIWYFSNFHLSFFLKKHRWFFSFALFPRLFLGLLRYWSNVYGITSPSWISPIVTLVLPGTKDLHHVSQPNFCRNIVQHGSCLETWREPQNSIPPKVGWLGSGLSLLQVSLASGALVQPGVAAVCRLFLLY